MPILAGGCIDIIFPVSDYVLDPYCYIERGTDQVNFVEATPGSLMCTSLANVFTVQGYATIPMGTTIYINGFVTKPTAVAAPVFTLKIFKDLARTMQYYV